MKKIFLRNLYIYIYISNVYETNKFAIIATIRNYITSWKKIPNKYLIDPDTFPTFYPYKINKIFSIKQKKESNLNFDFLIP